MRLLLKKYFIPHEGNDHRPHILRWTTVKVVLIGLLVLEGAFLVQVGFVYNHSSYLADIVESVLAADTNQNRIANSVPPLTVSLLLQEAAQMKANDMASKGYFSHISPDGSTPWDWMQKVGYSYSYAGENLAVNFVDSGDVVSAWMASPDHRANIIDGNYTEMGYGIAQGKYEGKEATFVVQMFGAPPETAAIASLLNGTAQPSSRSISSTYAKSAVISTGSQLRRIAAGSSVLGESAVATSVMQNANIPSQVGVVDKIIASPFATTEYVFFAMTAVFLIALGLKLLIRNKVRHPSLVLNGILVIFVVNCMLLLNRYIALAQLKIL